MSETIKQPMVSKSPLTGSYFYFTRHKPTANGKGMQIVGQKTDVTDSVSALVEQAIGEFLEYVGKTYDLGLYVPKLVEEDGERFLHATKEATGYEYLNDLVKEWREKS